MRIILRECSDINREVIAADMKDSKREYSGARMRRCSFCERPEHMIRRLISGPEGVYICDDCVQICLEILQEEYPEHYANQSKAIYSVWDEQPLIECTLREVGNNEIIAGKSIIALLDNEHIYAPVSGEIIYDSENRSGFSEKLLNGDPAIECILKEDVIYAPIKGTLEWAKGSDNFLIENGTEGLLLLCSVEVSDVGRSLKNNVDIIRLVNDEEDVLVGQPVLRIITKGESYAPSVDNAVHVVVVVLNADDFEQKRCGNFLPAEIFIQENPEEEKPTVKITGSVSPELIDKTTKKHLSSMDLSKIESDGKMQVDNDNEKSPDHEGTMKKDGDHNMGNLLQKADDLLRLFEEMQF